MIVACDLNSISLTRVKFSRKKLRQGRSWQRHSRSLPMPSSPDLCVIPRKEGQVDFALKATLWMGTQGCRAPGTHGGGFVRSG